MIAELFARSSWGVLLWAMQLAARATTHDLIWLVVAAFLLGALWLLFGPPRNHVGAAVAVVLAVVVAVMLL